MPIAGLAEMNGYRMAVTAAVLAAVVLALPAGAQDVPAGAPAVGQNLPDVALGSDEIYEQSLKALTVLFVTAILIENALAILFNWRVFLTYFSLRGVRTIVSVAVAAVVVWTFKLDVFAALLDVYIAGPVQSGPVTKALTALILAGGSSGVNSLMVALGYRDSSREEAVRPSAPANEAWIAVRVNRKRAVGPAQVTVTEVAAPQSDPPAIAGTIGFRRPSLRELLLRNENSFPANGGYVVEPGKVYAIEVIGYDAQNTRVPEPHLAGKEFRFAPRAIVDFEVTL